MGNSTSTPSSTPAKRRSFLCVRTVEDPNEEWIDKSHAPESTESKEAVKIGPFINGKFEVSQKGKEKKRGKVEASINTAHTSWRGKAEDRPKQKKIWKRFSSDVRNDADDSKAPVTSIVSLGDDFFLTASQSDSVIKMWKVNAADSSPTTVDFVRDFIGHACGVTCLVKLDQKGRFLSAGIDKTVRLWDSRLDCKENEEYDGAQEPRILLGTFAKLEKRWTSSLVVLNEGRYVRTTDDINMAMLFAVSKKAMTLDSSVIQRASSGEETWECSGVFATASHRSCAVKIWSMDVEDSPEAGDAAETKLEQELEHPDFVKSVLAVEGKGMLLSGTIKGDVRLWRQSKSIMGVNGSWSCERIFHSNKKTPEIQTLAENMVAAVSCLSFCGGDEIVVAGTKNGLLRVWKTKGGRKDDKKGTNSKALKIEDVTGKNGKHDKKDTESKEFNIDTNLMGVTSIQQLPSMTDKVTGKKCAAFAAASANGIICCYALRPFHIARGKNENDFDPFCFDVFDLFESSSDRFRDEKVSAVTALASLNVYNKKDDARGVNYVRLLVGDEKGDIHVLKENLKPLQNSVDSRVQYRERVEAEGFLIQHIAKELFEGVEIKDRTYHMVSYRQCFLGSDAVSLLVNNGYANARDDAVELGRIIARRMSSFEHVTQDYELVDDEKFYRFTTGTPSSNGDS